MEEEEWEEEEQLVVVELSGIINNDFLSKCGRTCKILDVDSANPIMQVGQYVFVGEYEDAIGSCVLFEEEQSNGNSDNSPELKYRCHTVKRLMMQRTFLTEKKEGETSAGSGDPAGQNDTPSHSTQDSKDTSQQAVAAEQQMEKGDREESIEG